MKALKLLDGDERHPSLKCHQLQGDRKGSWAVRASKVLRLTYLKQGDIKILLTCSKHYDR